MAWPSQITQLLLVLGLIPLGYALLRAARAGFTGLLDLEVLGILFIWIGYHLSPWLAYYSPVTWRDFLLVPEKIDTSLSFSIACMWCLATGAYWYRRRRRGAGRSPTITRKTPRVSAGWLWGLTFLSLALFVVYVHGLDQIWISERVHGEGQFDKRDAVGKILQMLAILTNTLNLVLMTLAAVEAGPARFGTRRYVRGLLTILIASFPLMWVFSRAAGVGLLILAMTTLYSRRSAGVVLAVVYLLLAVHLGRTGLSGRSLYQQGLGPFLEAATMEAITDSVTPERPLLPEPNENPLDATSAFTRKIYGAPAELSLDTMAVFIWNLVPLPSELTPLGRVGQDLAEVMGTVGSVGLPTPAMGELHYAFGLPGCLVFILFGALFAWFTDFFRREQSGLSYVLLILCFLSLPMGLHGGMRTMTRPILYAALLYGSWRLIQRKRAEAASRPTP